MERPQSQTIEAQLDAQVSQLDELLGEVRAGIRSTEHFDELEERASVIGREVRAAFRWGNRR